MKIGFIGAGRMAQALGCGIARNIADARFVIFDPAIDASRRFESLVGKEVTRIVHCSKALSQESDVLFVAVKPQMVVAALEGMKRADFRWPLVVSIVAGVSLERLAYLLGTARIVRVMPNTPCLIGQGISAVAVGTGVSQRDTHLAVQLMQTVGQVVEVSESKLDAVTGLSGSGPAYVYTFIEALIDAAVREGLPADVATQLTLQTVIGAAAMIAETGESPAVLRGHVTSPGGTTLAGLAELEKSGFADSVVQAVHAATRRSVELGKY